jgi:hypothetical protein
MKTFKILTYNIFDEPQNIKLGDKVVTRIPYVKEYSSYYKINNHYYA